MAQVNVSPYIIVTGTIGAGKSVLCRKLAQKFNWKEFTEPVESNPYLDDFYKNMKETSFQMQLYLLFERFKQHKMIEACSGGVVQDRSMYCAKVFAKMLKEDHMINDRDYATYINMSNTFESILQKEHKRQPTLMIYLDCKPEVAMQRIKNRNRECEKAIDLNYLQRLQTGYAEFLQQTYIPVLRINWDEFKSVDYVWQAIQSHLSKQL